MTAQIFYLAYLIALLTKSYYYTGRFIKNQQKYAKLIQLFTRAYRNKNTERKIKNKSRCSLHYITQTKKNTHSYIQNKYMDISPRWISHTVQT